jgi:pimeloyl-ACP methyl ester carboxylesterase
VSDYRIDAARGAVQAGATRLSYLDWGGDGPPALLLHGITSSAASLWQVAPAIRAAGYRPIALDMPGHGESDLRPTYHIDETAALVSAAAETLDLRDGLLLGHSWGGATALALAGGDHPARTRFSRVVLVDPALAMATSWGAERLPFYLDGLGEPASATAPRLRAANPDWADADVYWKAIALEQCRAQQVRSLFMPNEDWSLVERLGRVDVPLLLLVADPLYSVIPPERLGAARAALRPGLGRLVVVPGAVHNMFRGPWFAPTMAALQEWLA